MSGGDFGGINEFQLTDVTYCRTRVGALLAQVIMGREKWTDGFKQQVVEIIEPGNAIRTLIPPTVSFDDYPTHDKPDLMPNVDKNCITLPNGDCIADVDCMHTPDDERLPGCLDDDKLKHPYGRLGDFRPDAE